ncbi:MAG: DUF3108 domain-containing protein [candidate division WOR-3 bacterium]|nr:DUF3108 domain-containing protein [candidate division WOR-3 bacterium]
MFFSLLILVTAFSPGERLFYDIRYGPILVGSLELQVQPNIFWNGESCYHFQAKLKSNPKLNKIFSIDDELNSYVRISDFATLKSEKFIREKNYQATLWAIFDYRQQKIIYSDSSTFVLQPHARDLLTTWYYCRTIDLKFGNDFSIPVHIDKKNYQLKLPVVEVKTINLSNKKYHCAIIEPQTIPKSNLGSIYLSLDKSRYPVIIKNKLFLGELIATLKRVTSGQALEVKSKSNNEGRSKTCDKE